MKNKNSEGKQKEGKEGNKIAKSQTKSSCVACRLLCESGRETITQENVIDINSHEESNTKHSQWRHLKFTVFESASNYCPFQSASSAPHVSIPQPVSAKANWVTLNSLRRSSWSAHTILNEMTSGTIALTAMPAAQKGLQPLRRKRSDNKRLEKETSSARMRTDSQHMWLQLRTSNYFLSNPLFLHSYFALLFGCSTCVRPECLSALDIQQGREELFFFALLWKQHSSQNTSDIVCLWYLQLPVISSRRPLLALEGCGWSCSLFCLAQFWSCPAFALCQMYLQPLIQEAYPTYLSSHATILEHLPWKWTCPWLPWRATPGVTPRVLVGAISGDTCTGFKALLQAVDSSATRPTHLLPQQAVAKLWLTWGAI